jgi:hypothetical protein
MDKGRVGDRAIVQSQAPKTTERLKVSTGDRASGQIEDPDAAQMGDELVGDLGRHSI